MDMFIYRSPGLTQGSGKKLPSEANGTKGHITVVKEGAGIAEENDDVRANTLVNRAIVAARSSLKVRNHKGRPQNFRDFWPLLVHILARIGIQLHSKS